MINYFLMGDHCPESEQITQLSKDQRKGYIRVARRLSRGGAGREYVLGVTRAAALSAVQRVRARLNCDSSSEVRAGGLGWISFFLLYRMSFFVARDIVTGGNGALLLRRA